MSAESTFDPEATMSGFVAQQQQQQQPEFPAAPPRDAAASRTRTDHGSRVQDPLGAPPFGSRRGNRVAYTVNLPVELAGRLEIHAHGQPGRVSYGAIAVEAIRDQWENIRHEFGLLDEPGPFPMARVRDGLIVPGQPLVRKVLYYTSDEAEAIQKVRSELAYLELGQLHRLALDRCLV